MKARLEEAILGTIGARQEMVRRSRGEGCTLRPSPPAALTRVRGGPRGPVLPLCPAHFSQKSMRRPHTHGCLCPHLSSQSFRPPCAAPRPAPVHPGPHRSPHLGTSVPVRFSVMCVPLCLPVQRGARSGTRRTCAGGRASRTGSRPRTAWTSRCCRRRPVPGETGASGARGRG